MVEIKPESSIAIVLMGALGDVLRGTVVACQLKKALPDCRITWIVDSRWRSIVEVNTSIDEVLLFDRKRPIKGALSLYRELRKRKFDLTLDMQRHFKSGCCSILTGAERRIGFNKKNSKEFNFLFNNEKIKQFPRKHDKLDHYLEFIRHLGFKLSYPLEFGLEKLKTEQTAGELIAEAGGPGFTGLVLSSSWKSKDWPRNRYLELCRLLMEVGGERVVLFGTGADKESAEYLLENTVNILSEPIINMVSRTDLPQLAAMLKVAKVGVGPDSGPGHLAAVLGTPYIPLFGPTEPERVAPYQCLNLVVKADLECMPCCKRTCVREGVSCMESITAERVYQKIKEVYQMIGES